MLLQNINRLKMKYYVIKLCILILLNRIRFTEACCLLRLKKKLGYSNIISEDCVPSPKNERNVTFF